MFAAEAGFGDAHLGPEVFRCRLLSPKEQSKRAGFSAFDYYGEIVMALVLFPFMAVVVLVGIPIAISEALGAPVPPVPSGNWSLLVVMVLVYLLALVWVIWYCFFFLRQNHLALHQHGVKYRLGRKAGAVLFEDLREFRIGRDWTAFEGSAMGLNKHLHPGLHQMAENARHLSLTLTLARGDQIVLKGILMQYVEEDVNEFLTSVNQRYPHLVKIDP